jgi:hypothetical protein
VQSPALDPLGSFPNKIDLLLQSIKKIIKMELNISLMLSVKQKLERIPISNQDPEYKNIHCLVKKYLKDHCQHSIVTDSIDIDLDRSMTFHYCEYCETTFSCLSNNNNYVLK